MEIPKRVLKKCKKGAKKVKDCDGKHKTDAKFYKYESGESCGEWDCEEVLKKKK